MTPTKTNGSILQMLEESKAEEENKLEKNMFKVYAFRDAIRAIEGLDYAITSAEQASKVCSARVHDSDH